MFPPPRLDQLPGVRHKPRLMCISLAALNLVPGGICTDTPREKKKKTPEFSDICQDRRGVGVGGCWIRLTPHQDGKCVQILEEFGACKAQGIFEGLLQEEWAADTLGHRRGDGLRAWISPQDV